jgi:hypothetical protein
MAFWASAFAVTWALFPISEIASVALSWVVLSCGGLGLHVVSALPEESSGNSQNDGDCQK